MTAQSNVHYTVPIGTYIGTFSYYNQLNTFQFKILMVVEQ